MLWAELMWELGTEAFCFKVYYGIAIKGWN
jgi:hypothetical protein